MVPYDNRWPALYLEEEARIRRALGTTRAYHMHLVEIDSRLWRDHIGFRDRLRADAAVAAAYAALKLALAARFPLDRPSYIDGKAEFIQGVIRSTPEIGGEV